MRSLPLLLTMFAVSLTAEADPLPLAPGTELAEADQRQIGEIFVQWQGAWAAHDMRAFARLFHEDGTWVVWTGRVWKGRQAIEDGHVAAHQTFFRSSTQLSRPEEVRLVAPGVVVARSRTTLTGDSRAPGETIVGRKLLVLTKRAGVWRILYGQNTRLTDEVAAIR